MKKVIHEGKSYDIGGLYFDGLNSLVKLLSISDSGEFKTIDGSGNHSGDFEIYSSECSNHLKGSELGTIRNAPPKLEHGQWYAIRAQNQDDTCAMWNEKKKKYVAHTTEFNPNFWSPFFKIVKES